MSEALETEDPPIKPSFSQTETTMSEIEDLLLIKNEVDDTRRKCMLLKAELEVMKQKFDEDSMKLRAKTKEVNEAIKKIEFSEDNFKEDDEKVRFYTGLTNWSLLAIIVHFVQPFTNVHNCSTLSAFQVYLGKIFGIGLVYTVQQCHVSLLM